MAIIFRSICTSHVAGLSGEFAFPLV